MDLTLTSGATSQVAFHPSAAEVVRGAIEIAIHADVDIARTISWVPEEEEAHDTTAVFVPVSVCGGAVVAYRQ